MEARERQGKRAGVRERELEEENKGKKGSQGSYNWPR